MRLANRFPFLLAQVDKKGRYPVHIACAFGSSSKFVSFCIYMNPTSAAAKDAGGKTPTHFLCQGTWMDCWDAASNPAVEKNMLDILWMLYLKAPSSVVFEDNQGLGSIEYAMSPILESRLFKIYRI